MKVFANNKVYVQKNDLAYFMRGAEGVSIPSSIVEKVFGEKNLKKVNKWLGEKVHKYAGSKTPKEILLLATGEEFNPKYYIEYLKENYS